MSSMKLRIRFFGQFRDWVPASEVTIEMQPGASAQTIKGAITRTLESLHPSVPVSDLVRISALSTEDRILFDDEVVPPGVTEVSLLPPVCGG